MSTPTELQPRAEDKHTQSWPHNDHNNNSKVFISRTLLHSRHTRRTVNPPSHCDVVHSEDQFKRCEVDFGLQKFGRSSELATIFAYEANNPRRIPCFRCPNSRTDTDQNTSKRPPNLLRWPDERIARIARPTICCGGQIWIGSRVCICVRVVYMCVCMYKYIYILYCICMYVCIYYI